MTRVLIWDLPTRLFHWLLSAGFLAAAGVSLLLGEHSPLFAYHSIIGLTIALMVCMRVVWGVVGTRYARFGSFVFGPGAVIEYMKGVLTRSGKRHIGHNPGSAYAIFAMLAMVLGLAGTGVMMARGNEGVKEVHEILAYAMVAVVIAHVLGVALHTVRHKENLVGGMIHGGKEAEPAQAIASSQPVAAVIFLVITGAWAIGLVRNFNAATQTTTLPLVGASLQIGEVENEGRGKRESGGEEHDDDDD